jgi:hypothetical protein
MFQLGLLESQGFAKPTNPLLKTYVPSCATKTMHICICSNQHGCDEMNQALVPPVRPQFLCGLKQILAFRFRPLHLNFLRHCRGHPYLITLHQQKQQHINIIFNS